MLAAAALCAVASAGVEVARSTREGARRRRADRSLLRWRSSPNRAIGRSSATGTNNPSQGIQSIRRAAYRERTIARTAHGTLGPPKPPVNLDRSDACEHDHPQSSFLISVVVMLWSLVWIKGTVWVGQAMQIVGSIWFTGTDGTLDLGWVVGVGGKTPRTTRVRVSLPLPPHFRYGLPSVRRCPLRGRWK